MRGSVRFVLLLTTVSLVLVAASTAPPTEVEENLLRLKSMPLEQRILLAKNLERFDSLSSDQRQAIEEIDQRIRGLDPISRVNYLDTLRVYHLWQQHLSAKDQERIAHATSNEDRLKIVEQIKKGQSPSTLTEIRQLGLPIGDLGAMPPIELGNYLRIWMMLSPEEKHRVESYPQIRRRLEELQKLGNRLKVETRSLTPAQEAALLARLNQLAMYKSLLAAFKTRQEKKAENKAGLLKKKFDTRPETLVRPLDHLTQSLYFAENPPKRVEPSNLARFEAALPAWMRDSLDPLPASEARRRLTILYREVYPHPSEMPLPSKAATKGSQVEKHEKTTPGVSTPF